MFEDVLTEKERIIVYTKKDLGDSGDVHEDAKVWKFACYNGKKRRTDVS